MSESLFPAADTFNAVAPYLSLDGEEVHALCVSVYDGDTITVVFPFKGEDYKWRCRLLGINTAEMRGTRGTEKEKAIAARDYVRKVALDKVVRLKLGSFDKYGRLLANVYLEDGTHVNSTLLDLKLAVPYMV